MWLGNVKSFWSVVNAAAMLWIEFIESTMSLAVVVDSDEVVGSEKETSLPLPLPVEVGAEVAAGAEVGAELEAGWGCD
jgi:hypothetical protein